MKQLLSIYLLFSLTNLHSQSYTSYFTGNTSDLITAPQGGTCMMGGATEHDGAMKWFLERANGGDVLVLRASGSDGYNDYLYTDLGINVNSVETIVFNNSNASNETYIQNKIKNAEAIWFAGGDQWNYISYLRDTPIDSLINIAIQDKNIVIGGTSAGMAILGNYYFSAQNGTVTSATALDNPFNSNITVDSSSFLKIDYLQNVITDSHYDDPNRKGRHVVFLSRILTDYGVEAKGIACNEYTSVCIDENGIAKVFGDYPNYPETAFFLQTNCELTSPNPENCTANTPLDWNLNSSAIKVYKVNGTNEGTNTFDLNDWKTGSGGEWENWFIDNGTLNEIAGNEVDCTLSTQSSFQGINIEVYPNPINDAIFITSEIEIEELELFDITGKILFSKENLNVSFTSIDTRGLLPGLYLIKVHTKVGSLNYKVIKN